MYKFLSMIKVLKHLIETIRKILNNSYDNNSAISQDHANILKLRIETGTVDRFTGLLTTQSTFSKLEHVYKELNCLYTSNYLQIISRTL